MKKVTVIGLGPGGGADLTGRARAALEGCDLIVGYTAYIELVKPDFPENRDDYQFHWSENEYVISLAPEYIYLVNAVDRLLK